MDFHGVDLNLLVAFDALVRECNVTRAAAKVGVSQPAMSAALARLRQHFGDPLFLRSAQGLMPTARARELAVPIAEALQQLKAVLVAPAAFVAANATATFTLGLADYSAFVLLPSLIQALNREAPDVMLKIQLFSNRDDAVDLLDAGKIDAAVGVPPTKQESRILTRELWRDEFVTLVNKDSPHARRGMTMKTFLSMKHLLVSPEGDQYGLVDQLLAEQGLQRALRVTVPQMFVVPAILAATDLAATVLKRVVLCSGDSGKLLIFAPPVALPEISFGLIWHRRNEGSQAQQWFRELITTVAGWLQQG